MSLQINFNCYLALFAAHWAVRGRHTALAEADVHARRNHDTLDLVLADDALFLLAFTIQLKELYYFDKLPRF